MVFLWIHFLLFGQYLGQDSHRFLVLCSSLSDVGVGSGSARSGFPNSRYRPLTLSAFEYVLSSWSLTSVGSLAIFFFRSPMICLLTLCSRFAHRYMASLSCVYFCISSDCIFLITMRFLEFHLMISIHDYIALFIITGVQPMQQVSNMYVLWRCVGGTVPGLNMPHSIDSVYFLSELVTCLLLALPSWVVVHS